MASSMTLTVTFDGAFAFWFYDQYVNVYAPVCDGHSGYVESDFDLTAMPPGTYELTIAGRGKSKGKRTHCHNPSDILTVDSKMSSGMIGPAYWQLTLPKPGEVAGLHKDPAKILDGNGNLVKEAPIAPVTAMRFYYPDFDPKAGVKLSGAVDLPISDTTPPECQKEFPITFHYQGPPPDGTDNDAMNCFVRMARLFPPYDGWTMGKPSEGKSMLLRTTTHDCKTALLALAPGAKIA